MTSTGLDASRRWKERNPNHSKEYYQRTKKRQLEYSRAYHAAHSEKASARQRRYRENNPERYNEYQRDYTRQRRKEDMDYKIRAYLRRRLHKALKRNQKTGSAVSDLGCSIAAFTLYIENQFEEGMTWDNWGKDGWHLDHVLPLASFDLTNRMEFLEAANWLNYQPLWADDNIRKSDKIGGEL